MFDITVKIYRKEFYSVNPVFIKLYPPVKRKNYEATKE